MLGQEIAWLGEQFAFVSLCEKDAILKISCKVG